MGIFIKEFCGQDLSKIPQSDHTVLDSQSWEDTDYERLPQIKLNWVISGAHSKGLIINFGLKLSDSSLTGLKLALRKFTQKIGYDLGWIKRIPAFRHNWLRFDILKVENAGLETSFPGIGTTRFENTFWPFVTKCWNVEWLSKY